GGCASPAAACASPTATYAPTVSQGFQIFTQPPDPSSFTGTFQSQNGNFKQGRVQQFNLNLEHQILADVLLTVGYAGSRSHHILFDGLNLNVSSPNACDPTSPEFVPGYTLGCGIPVAPYGFSIIANINDVGSARYDSLQVKAETKNASHGLYA